jgi:hypothetical protein
MHRFASINIYHQVGRTLSTVVVKSQSKKQIFDRLHKFVVTRYKWLPSRRIRHRTVAAGPTDSSARRTRPGRWPGSGSRWPSSAFASDSS